MKCPKCQHDNPGDVKFCGECGAKLELVCPSCKTTNLAGNKFCNECGQDLRSVFESPSEGYENPQSFTPADLAQKIVYGRKHVEEKRKLVAVFEAVTQGNFKGAAR